ncbi:MAG: M20/M25/M40 family metallo-hydrolase [Clostridia bacterium]|nr:M20/M25/M40 family metallo-hydrolase [Clostridia bacterium]
MSKNWTPKELMYDLVKRESESFTPQETEMARHIHVLIQEQAYWQEHPDYCGLYDGGDLLGRLIPWALRRGRGARTVILTGHFDCVETRNYGALQPFALEPDRLKEELKKLDWDEEMASVREDLESPDWCFGRGVADMKGGLACAMTELFRHAEKGLAPDVNLLFVAVHDEEHQAEGIMQAVGLLAGLKETYGLDYAILLNPEPAGRRQAAAYTYVDGSIGKILPGIVVKGDSIHVANILSGLSSTFLAARIAARIDLNPDFRSGEFGKETPPPVVLCLRDCKEEYNVSAPRFTELYCHIPMTKSQSLPALNEKLKAVCREAAAEAVARHQSVQAVCQPGGKAGQEPPAVRIMSCSELDAYCGEKVPDYAARKEAFLKQQIAQVKEGRVLIQEGGGLAILRWMIDCSGIPGPLVVIGLLPPYVPPVNNHYMPGFDREGMIREVAAMLRERFGRELIEDPYSMGMSDNSYTGCTEIAQDLLAMKEMVCPPELYHIPFAEIEKIAVPSVLIGPWGKDYHTMTERVYLPDIEAVTPAVLACLIRRVAEEAREEL